MAMIDDSFFESLLVISKNWCKEFICECHSETDGKILAKAYALNFTGQKYLTYEWAKHVTRSLKNFIYDPTKIADMLAKGQEPYQEAMLAFGDADPIRDGKYGELILFLLVESILRAPIMVHKVAHLMNRNDQAKGADNVFVGVWKGKRTIFVGESKIKTRYSAAVTEALDSLNRFYQQSNSAQTDQEYVISRSAIRKDLTQEQLDYLYSLLDPADELHRNANKAHPVFIMYNYNEIQSIEIECEDNIHADQLLNSKLEIWLKDQILDIKEKLNDFPELLGVELIFYLIPVKDTNEFRKLMYTNIHGTSYRERN